jgi:hypothetical protein
MNVFTSKETADGRFWRFKPQARWLSLSPSFATPLPSCAWFPKVRIELRRARTLLRMVWQWLMSSKS